MSQELVPRSTIPCPVCDNVNPAGATSCLRCGVLFRAIPRYTATSQASSESVPEVATDLAIRAKPSALRRRSLLALLAVGACVAIAPTIWSGVEGRIDNMAWDQAVALNTTAAYREYLSGGTIGAHSEEARKEIRRRIDESIVRLQSHASGGNREAIQGLAKLAENARDVGTDSLPVYFVRDVQLGDADLIKLAKQAGASTCAPPDLAVLPLALTSNEAELVRRLDAEMRDLGFDELRITYATRPVDVPAIRVSYSIRSDGDLYRLVSPDDPPGVAVTDRSAPVYTGLVVRARYEFIVPRGQPLFAFEAEAQPAEQYMYSGDPYSEMCALSFEIARKKFTDLFYPAPARTR